MDYPIKLAEQLRPQLIALRRKRKITQSQLGQMLGVSQARVVEIEANPGLVSFQQIMMIFSFLNATLVVRENDDAEQQPPMGGKAPKSRSGSW